MPKKGSPSGDSRGGFENKEDVLPGEQDEKEDSRPNSLSDPDHIASDGEDDDVKSNPPDLPLSDLESELETLGEAALEDADEDG